MGRHRSSVRFCVACGAYRAAGEALRRQAQALKQRRTADDHHSGDGEYSEKRRRHRDNERLCRRADEKKQKQYHPPHAEGVRQRCECSAHHRHYCDHHRRHCAVRLAEGKSVLFAGRPLGVVFGGGLLPHGTHRRRPGSAAGESLDAPPSAPLRQVSDHRRKEGNGVHLPVCRRSGCFAPSGGERFGADGAEGVLGQGGLSGSESGRLGAHL